MLEREFGIRPAFDKRSPDPSRNYGINGAEMFFYVKGPEGAIQFVIYTQWHLPNVHQELVARYTGRHCSMEPMAADIGYHSPRPMYDGQEPLTDSCPLLNGAKCYYDGSSLNAQKYFDILVAEGHESLWKALEQYYHSCFSAEEKPTAEMQLSGAGTDA